MGTDQGISQPESYKKPEMNLGKNLPIPVPIIDKVSKSICKIIIKNNPKDIYGTGFFLKISDYKKYLITNYHLIYPDILKEDIEIQIHNKEKKKINFKKREIKFLPRPKDITIIEIKNTDKIHDEVLFLDYDLNYQKGYKRYKDADIFSLLFLNGEDPEYSCGKIVRVDGFEFDHDISTDNGSSGSPIILHTKNINLIEVIGIHKEANYLKRLNTGTFIGEIFKNENDDSYNGFNIKITNHEIISKNEKIKNSINFQEPVPILIEGIPQSLIDKAKKTICKIMINNINYGTGFFMKISDSQKYLITDNCMLSQNKINENIEIQIYNSKIMKLNFNNRLNKFFFESPKNIVIIELKNNDEIYNDIEFLDYDLNYLKGYDFYKDINIFTIYFSKEGHILFGKGKIVSIFGYEFNYNISKEQCCLGRPILLFNCNLNLIRVIGIHKESNHLKDLSTGTFIGEIISNKNNDLNESSKINKNVKKSFSHVIDKSEANIMNESIHKSKATKFRINTKIAKTSNNEIYVPYSCITGLEKNDLSFPNPLNEK